MANVAYALMVRDLSSGVDRAKMDDALAGVITIDNTLDQPSHPPDRIAPLPQVPKTIGPIQPGSKEYEKLRESWGRDQTAIREKLLFDQTVRNMPSQKGR